MTRDMLSTLLSRSRCRLPVGARAAVVTLLGVPLLSSCRPFGQAAADRPKAGAGGAATAPSLPSGSPASAAAGLQHRAGAPQAASRDPFAIPLPPGDTPSGAPAGGLPAGSANVVPAAAPPGGAAAPTTPSSGKLAFAADGALAQRLKVVVEDAVSRGVARRVGVAVYDLATGQGAGLNAGQNFRPASVIKLAVLVAAFRARPTLSAGQFDRLRPDLQRMITISDNAATRRLVRRLGAHSVNAAVRELGIEHFRVGESGSQEWVLRGSQASPADTALLLARIARREAVSPEACDEMLALLGAQKKRWRIPAGLPSAPDLWVGNKTGTLSGVVNDAGIVLQPRRGIGYTLAIFSSGARSEAAGERLIADLSAVVYGYLAAPNRG